MCSLSTISSPFRFMRIYNDKDQQHPNKISGTELKNVNYPFNVGQGHYLRLPNEGLVTSN